MKVVHFCGHWSVRDLDDNLLSHWFHSELEALTELQNLQQEESQEGFDF